MTMPPDEVYRTRSHPSGRIRVEIYRVKKGCWLLMGREWLGWSDGGEER